jgi:hypothetical protein
MGSARQEGRHGWCLQLRATRGEGHERGHRELMRINLSYVLSRNFVLKIDDTPPPGCRIFNPIPARIATPIAHL